MSELGQGTYLKVFDHAEGFIVCVPEDEPRVDAAVSAYIDSGGRDQIIEVTMLEGVSYKLLASTVSSWFISTPESRKLRVGIDAANGREYAAHRQELGIWDDDQ